MTRNGVATSLILCALLAACLWAYWNSLWNPFHFDDALFLQSPQVTEPGDFWYLLRPAQSRPLTFVTFFWNYRLGSASPFGYHLVNLFLHLANVLGVYFFTRLLVQSRPESFAPWMRHWLPFASAGIFAMHPVQSEAVNYVYQRSALLAAFFALLSMNCFLRARLTRHRKLWLAGSGICFLLAVASKESALILPILWIAWLWAESGDLNAFSRVVLRVRWAIVACIAALLGGTWSLVHLWDRGWRSTALEFLSRSTGYLLAQIQVLPSYIRLLILPVGLSVDHDFRPAPAASAYGLLCLLLLAAIVAVIFRSRSRNSSRAFLMAAFLLLLAPTSSIIPSHDLFFEHRLYLPMTAGAILMAWSLLTLIRRIPIPAKQTAGIAVAGFCLLLGCYSAMARQRTYVWGDNVRLWEDAAAKAPLKVRTHYNLGASCLNRDRNRAQQELLRAVELDPKYAAAYYDLGWLAQVAGDRDSASKYYGLAIQVDAKIWQAHHNLGNIDILQGHPQEAMREFKETIRLRGDYGPAYVNLATLQLRAGDTRSALQTLEGLMRFHWDLLEARYLRATAFMREGRTQEAENELNFIAGHDRAGAYRDRVAALRGMLSVRAESAR